ncbi:hypothetical protein BST61_g11312 [Cercospora zeina]
MQRQSGYCAGARCFAERRRSIGVGHAIQWLAARFALASSSCMDSVICCFKTIHARGRIADHDRMPRKMRKRKSAALADQQSPKRRKHVRKDDYNTKDENAAQEDVFIRNIHARPINERYLLGYKLGEGGFGMVFLEEYRGWRSVCELARRIREIHRVRSPA